MVIHSMLPKCCQTVTARAAQMLAVGSVLALCLPLTALAQTPPLCGPEIKEEVAKALSSVADASEDQKLAVEAELYAKYEDCAQDAKLAPASFHEAAKQCGARVPILGSLFFEEMSCCGYDPQRRQFACPVKISQPFGFGAAPLPGSREHVLHCVADATGVLVPVGHDSVHLANAIRNQEPTWQFAVIANAHENLFTVYPMNGQTRRARSILSWGFTPTDCDYQPIWGNALDYHIRLDQ
ncbi:MAG TPA: hypothetical protein VIH59_04360 [Candidatus Tectomicrobia bacterium]